MKIKTLYLWQSSSLCP